MSFSYPGKFNHIIDSLYSDYIKFGQFDIVELATQTDYELRISWKHGINYWFTVRLIPREEVITMKMSTLIEIVAEMVNLRDTKIRDVTFWTNCTEIK
jgi:hypothetical protein